MAQTPEIDLTKPNLSTDPDLPDVWGAINNANWDKIDAGFVADRGDISNHTIQIGDHEERITAIEEATAGSGHTIVFNGVPLPQRSKLAFGAGFYVYDDEDNDQTVIEFVGLDEPAGSIYFAGEPLYFAGEPLVVGG